MTDARASHINAKQGTIKAQKKVDIKKSVLCNALQSA
jgi:hypothetical protein